MNRLFRMTIVVTALCVLGACVVVPVGPRYGYYGPRAVVVPVEVYRHR